MSATMNVAAFRLTVVVVTAYRFDRTKACSRYRDESRQSVSLGQFVGGLPEEPVEYLRRRRVVGPVGDRPDV